MLMPTSVLLSRHLRLFSKMLKVCRILIDKEKITCFC